VSIAFSRARVVKLSQTRLGCICKCLHLVSIDALQGVSGRPGGISALRRSRFLICSLVTSVNLEPRTFICVSFSSASTFSCVILPKCPDDEQVDAVASARTAALRP
jgi:hypothetical protein